MLRPTNDTDLSILRRFFADPGFNERWGGRPLTDEEITAKYTGARSPQVECFIVEEAGQPIGFVQYHAADDDDPGGGLDMALVSAVRGRGLGSEVVAALVLYLRTQLGWQRITVDPDVSNQRGVNFWTKVGFEPAKLVDTDPEREPYMLMIWPHRNSPGG